MIYLRYTISLIGTELNLINLRLLNLSIHASLATIVTRVVASLQFIDVQRRIFKDFNEFR